MPLERISVAVDLPLRRCFDYQVPPGMQLAAGMRVEVPFGRRTLVGMVLGAGTDEEQGREYKMVARVLDAAPLAPPDWLALLRWAAGYWHHPLGEVIAAALPAALREGRSAEPVLARRYALTAAGALARAGLPARAVKQRALLESLAAGALLVAPGEPLPVDSSVLRRALAAGWVQQAPLAASAALDAPQRQGPQLTPAQAAALAELQAAPAGFSVSLLQGVTGSGKTELYLRLTAEALAAGRQVLVLCPEIGLTPQLLERFKQRFSGLVMSYHSGMTEAERARAWLAIRDGVARVLVGTRSAVFAPFAQLGLVIVDEEHDLSYKQQEGFRYQARDVALLRAQRAGCAALLGSATPALETLANAQAGRYRRVQLTARIAGGAPPMPQLIDLASYPARHGLSEPLAAAIERHLAAGGQALLFINRRGYAPTLLCDDCGWMAPCPACDARLTVHRGRALLRCHHCGHERPLPGQCPSCDSRRLLPVGEGAERVEDALRNRFPGRRIERFDSDRLRARGALAALLEEVREQRVQILVGTQMLAKGHDFPALSLVGVVNADQALYSADFRALERWGQQLTQVAGRAGRIANAPVAPEVIIQTREPRHPRLATLLHQGYGALAAELLKEREDAGLPPYAHLAVLRAEAATMAQARGFLAAAAEVFAPQAGVELLGPAPAPMERREARYRAQLLLSAATRAPLHQALSAWLPAIEALPAARRQRWSLDVDPADLF